MNPPVPKIVQWGRWLLALCLVAMSLGGTFVSIFLPEREGAGIDFWMWFVLIPIWSVGVAGIFLLLIGWTLYPTLDDRLDLGIDTNKHGKVLSRPTRWLATLTICIFLLALLLNLFDEELGDIRTRLVLYCFATMSLFLLYVLHFFNPVRQRATTTYLNHFGMLVGTLLIPLAWPAMVWLNLRKPAASRDGNGLPTQQEVSTR